MLLPGCQFGAANALPRAVPQPPEPVAGAARRLQNRNRHDVLPAIVWMLRELCDFPFEAIHIIADLVMPPDPIHVGTLYDLTGPNPIQYYQSIVDGIAVRRTCFEKVPWTQYDENGVTIHDLTFADEVYATSLPQV
jgi:hypothetical protein